VRLGQRCSKSEEDHGKKTTALSVEERAGQYADRLSRTHADAVGRGSPVARRLSGAAPLDDLSETS
jgi:hypothetical protein